MDYQNTFAISAAGMSVERLRVEVAALNLANANTVVDTGGGFRPLRVVAHAAAHASAGDFSDLIARGMAAPVASVEASNIPDRQVLEPGHPLADARGLVTYPGVDPLAEMMTLVSATRSYEANVAAMNAARSMAMKALDIGGST